MAIAMTRIEEENRGAEKTELSATLYNGELRKLLGESQRTNLYTTLKKVSQRLTGHPIVIEDGQGNFRTFAMVTNADYVDGAFRVRFNDALKPHLIEIKTRRGYTTLELSVILNAKKNSTVKIYELLRSQVYKRNKNINDGMVRFEIDIYEFRFAVGVANSEEPEVKNAIGKMGNDIDWKYLYENVAKFKNYEDWRDLKKRIILPAQKELAEISDIRFEFEGIRTVGNNYGKIVFYIYENEPSSENKEKIKEKVKSIEEVNYTQMTYPRDFFKALYEEYEGHNYLSREDLDILLREANFESELVVKAINEADRQKEISNYVGWIISYIRYAVRNNGKGYDENKTPVMDGDADQAIRANNILKDYNSRRDEIAKEVWEKIKEKPEFAEFRNYYYQNGYEIEELEGIYSPKEMFEKYKEWEKEQKKS